MLKRIITAAVLLVLLFGTLILGGLFSPYIIDAVVFVCATVAVYEICGALKRAGYDPIVPGLVAAIVVMAPITVMLPESGVGIIAGVSIGMIVALAVFVTKHNYEVKDLMATGFAMIYPLALIGMLAQINHSMGSMIGLLLCIFVPVLTDTMAYFVGIAIGKRKLCPNISPKKTIAGAVGGIVGGVLGAFLVFVLFDWTGVLCALSSIDALSSDIEISLAIYLAVGYFGAFACEVGDLAASWLKRKAGIKDFGKIFPGHGGIMDRLDSILFMVPIVYLMFALLLKFELPVIG